MRAVDANDFDVEYGMKFLVSIRDYASVCDLERFATDMGWTQESGYVEHWTEEKFLGFRRNPLQWYFDIDQDSKEKFVKAVLTLLKERENASE